MAQYFEARNGPNVVQIDDTFSNLVFTQRLTAPVVPAARPGNPGGGAFSFTVTGQNPVVAFTGEHNAVLTSRTQNGNQFTFTGMTLNVGSFVVLVFDSPGLAGPARFLEIRNAQNQLVFDGGQKYMRVAAMCNTVLTATNQQIQVGLAGGRQYAALQGMNGGVGQVVGGPVGGGPSWRTNTISYRAIVNIVGDSYVAKLGVFFNVYNEGERPPVYPNVQGWGRGLALSPILDVTNY